MRRLILLAMALSGCAPAIQPGAPMLRHVVLPADVVSENPAVNASSGATIPQKWWNTFHDLNLNRLVDIALSGNPSLEEVRARLGKAQAVVSQFDSALLPSIHSEGNVSRQHNSKNGNHGIYNDKTSTIANINPLVFTYKLDVWSRNSELVAAARASAQIQEAEFRQNALLLSSSVVKTYFTLLTAIQLKTTQFDIVAQSEEKAQLLKAAYQAGIQSKIPTLEQDADLLKAKTDLSKLGERVAADRFALLALLGRSPGDTDPQISNNVSIPDRFDVPQSINLDLISQRPDIQAALWNIKRQVHFENVARDAFYPNINLYALMGLNSIGLTNLLSTGSFAYAFGPAIDLPLFEGGALEGRLHEAESDYDIAVHAYNHAVLESVRQIATYLAIMKNSRTQIDDRETSIALITSKRTIAEQGYRSGTYGKLPYLDAAIAVDQEKMVQIENILGLIFGIADLATSLGGGFGTWEG